MGRIAPLAFLCLLATAARADSPPAGQVPTPAGDAQMSPLPTFLLGNAASNERAVKVTLYGFVEADTLYDSTQSFVETQGNTSIAKQGTEAGDNGRWQMGARNSRLGFKIESPATAGGISAMGNLEMDFLGANNGTTEAGIYTAPTARMRHGFLKMQTPWVDVLLGQTWTPFAGSGIFLPATIDIQGIPAEIYQRTLQLRVGKTVSFGDFTAELELAAVRPYQRDSARPDLAGYLRLVETALHGYKATSGTGGDETGAQLVLSALTHRFRALSPTATSTSDYETATGRGFALDAIVPLLPASKKDRGNGLTFVGELSTGTGYGDVFTSNNFGVTSLGTPAGAASSYTTGASLDPGPAAFNQRTGVLGTVDAKSMLLSLQYFLPVDQGAAFVSVLYGALLSDNAVDFTSAATAMPDERFLTADLFWDLTSAVRLGVSYGKTRQRYGDNSAPRTNDRAQLSGFYVF